MAKKRNNDFVNFLRSQGLRKRVAKAMQDLESGASDARGNAEKIGKRVIADLRAAADEIEKRLNIGSSSARKAPARKAAKKRTATKRRTPARKTAARKTSARKTTARKTSARKSTARKSTAKRSTSARKTTARKSAARKSS